MCSPPITTRPPLRARAQARSRLPGRPMHSITRCGAPPSSRSQKPATSSLEGSQTAVAPSCRASSRRVCTGSLTTISPNPRVRAHTTTARPTGPAPSTARVSPGFQCTASTIFRPTAKGSTSAPSAASTPGGSRKVSFSPTITYSANAPLRGIFMPIIRVVGQWAGSPLRQWTQRPQPMIGRLQMPSLSLKRSTPGPSSATVPANS
ncbi:hypothetical protein D3C76_1260900 [compost metagenome]